MLAPSMARDTKSPTSRTGREKRGHPATENGSLGTPSYFGQCAKTNPRYTSQVKRPPAAIPSGLCLGISNSMTPQEQISLLQDEREKLIHDLSQMEGKKELYKYVAIFAWIIVLLAIFFRNFHCPSGGCWPYPL